MINARTAEKPAIGTLWESKIVCIHSNRCLTCFVFHAYQPLNWQGGGGSLNLLRGVFGLKFLPLDQLPNAFAQLFLSNEHIF